MEGRRIRVGPKPHLGLVPPKPPSPFKKQSSAHAMLENQIAWLMPGQIEFLTSLRSQVESGKPLTERQHQACRNISIGMKNYRSNRSMNMEEGGRADGNRVNK